jgi:hypothetical protein
MFATVGDFKANVLFLQRNLKRLTNIVEECTTFYFVTIVRMIISLEATAHATEMQFNHSAS